MAVFGNSFAVLFLFPRSFGNIALWLDGAVNTSFLLDDTRSVCVCITDGLVDGLVLSRQPGTRCYCQRPGRIGGECYLGGCGQPTGMIDGK